MNTKLVLTYSNKNGTVAQIIEYHLNTPAAYKAAEAISKHLGPEIIVESVQFLPVIKHLELAPEVKLSQSDTNYSEVK